MQQQRLMHRRLVLDQKAWVVRHPALQNLETSKISSPANNLATLSGPLRKERIGTQKREHAQNIVEKCGEDVGKRAAASAFCWTALAVVILLLGAVQ